MSDFNYPTTIDKMIVAARKLQGVDQVTLAARTGIQRTYISRIETANALPTNPQLAAIEAALGIRFSDPAVQAAFLVLLGNHNEAPDAQ